MPNDPPIATVTARRRSLQRMVRRRCFHPSSHVESATCHLGDSEAVFQHLKPDNLTIGDGEHDGEVRHDDLAVSFEFRRERTKYYCSVVAGQNIVNLEADPLDHGARVT